MTHADTIFLSVEVVWLGICPVCESGSGSIYPGKVSRVVVSPKTNPYWLVEDSPGEIPEQLLLLDRINDS